MDVSGADEGQPLRRPVQPTTCRLLTRWLIALSQHPGSAVDCREVGFSPATAVTDARCAPVSTIRKTA